MKKDKVLIGGNIIAIIVLIVSLIFSYSSNEYSPVIPGWHTVIYPIGEILIVTTIVILTVTVGIAISLKSQK